MRGMVMGERIWGREGESWLMPRDGARGGLDHGTARCVPPSLCRYTAVTLQRAAVALPSRCDGGRYAAVRLQRAVATLPLRRRYGATGGG